MTNDARLYAPSVARNITPIFDVLQSRLPKRGRVLEVASGSGEHIVHLAQSGPSELEFQPSDPSAEARASIDAWVDALSLTTVLPALELDVTVDNWPVDAADMVMCINMIHIAPWLASVGLIRGAAKLLPPGGTLFLYGPYAVDGQHTAPSNAAFDADLRRRNPEWGVRNLEDIVELAHTHGFEQPDITPMPANNLALFFKRAA